MYCYKEVFLNKNNKRLPIILTIILFMIVASIYFFEFLGSYVFIQGLGLLMYFIYIMAQSKRIYIKSYIVPMLIFSIYLIFNILIGGAINFIVVFILNIMLLAMLSITPTANVILAKIIAMFSGIHLIFTLLVEILPVEIINKLFKSILGNNYYSNWDWRIQQNTNVGITIQPGNNALYLTTFFAFCIAHIITSRTENKNKYLLLSILSIIGLLTTAKRAPLIINFISVIIVYIVYNSDKIDIRKYIKMAVFLMIIMLGFLVIYKETDIFSSIQQKQVMLQSTNDISNGRFILWEYAIQEFFKSPIWGVGLKNIHQLIGLDVHNVYIQLLAETGLIGILLFLVAIFSLMFNPIMNASKIKYCKDIKVRRSIVMGIYLSIYLLLYGMLSNPFIDYIPLGIFIFAIFMANSYKVAEVKKWI